MIKSAAKRFLLNFGLDVRRAKRPVHPNSIGYGGNQWDFSPLQPASLDPDLVVDVGVAWGTPELYEAFPSARLLLVEPIVEFNQKIEELVAKRDYKLVNIAAGESTGDFLLHFNADRPHQSSLHKRSLHDGTTRKVELAPIDEIVGDEKGERIVLKIDVEGGEVEALRGATNTLHRSVCVFVEVNMGYMFDAPRNPLPEVTNILSAHGFTLFQVMDAAIEKSQGLMSVSKVDLCYIREQA